MSKEMFISSSTHETKLAVMEDEQLVEVYFERDTDVGLVGGIYKGRVSRVLPGMQSAFVDIGLDRDAFLYVSDFFFEDQEDYDKILDEAEAAVSANGEAAVGSPAPGAPQEAVPPVTNAAGSEPQTTSVAVPSEAPIESRDSASETSPPPPAPPATPSGTGTTPESHEQSRFEPRGRRWRHRGRKFGEHRHSEHKYAPRQESANPPAFEILPGESLAKYSHAATGSPGVTITESVPAEPETAEGEVLEVAVSGEAAEVGEIANLEPESAASSVPLDQPRFELTAEAPAAAAASTEAAAAFVPARECAGPALDAAGEVSPVVAPAAPAVTATDEKSRVGTSLADADPADGATSLDSVPETASESVEPTTEAEEVEAIEERIGLAPSAPSVDSKVQPDDSPLEAGEEIDSDSGELLAEEPTEAALAEEAADELSAEPSAETVPPTDGPAETALPAQNQEMQGGPAPAGQAGAGEGAGAPGEGTYTVREPHQRPRFAPRRGRRGRRGSGYQGRGGEPRWESKPGNNQPVQIAKLLKEGQEILVQISKEPLGTKGARITSHVALPGRYLVYMPTVEHIGVSRKISSEEERLRLRNIILEHKGSLTGGFIVRTAGQGRDEEELKADLKFLSTLWNEIKTKTERAKAPALIHRDLDLVQRVLRDTLTPDFKSVRVDNEVQYERVLEFVNRAQPSLIGKVKLYTRDTPLFEEFGIQSEIEKALKPKVWLKSGGYIVINQTEALVAIDVNTGKYVGKTNRLEDTILKTNFEAVNEIVRQIRLRDLGGIIVIDFIDMDERKNRAKVTQALEEALRKDRAPTKVIAFHDFGLVAITRKRVKQSLERTLCERCSYCSGSGWVKSPTTVCYEILSEARKMAGQIEGKIMTVRVNPEVAKLLKSREGTLVSELESLTQKDVIIKSDPVVEQERFEIF